MPCLVARKATIGEHKEAGTARIFLYHRKLLEINLAVMPCSSARKAAIGEHLPAGVARFPAYFRNNALWGRNLLGYDRRERQFFHHLYCMM